MKNFHLHGCENPGAGAPPNPTTSTAVSWRFHGGFTAVSPKVHFVAEGGRQTNLAFSSYGKWSPEVHELLRATATQTAQRQWRHMGASSLAEALGSITQRLRHRWAMVSMRGHARLRLSRLQCVGTGGFRAQAAAAAAAAQGWPGDFADPGFVPALGGD